MDLPSTIPIFPLPNIVLFPGVPLPLHIFEPRFRQLVRDVTDGHEIIGMVLLRGDWRKDYYGNPDVFGTGCAGRVVNAEALPDGKFNILLHGLREFVVRRHILDKPYRQAEVQWRVGGQGALGASCRSGLITLLSRFLEAEAGSPAQRLLQDQSLSDDLLVNFFSYALQIAPLEKQGLLEEATLAARAARLSEIIEFHLEESRLTLKGYGPDRRH